MAGIKQLAGQTLWYGASSIIARLLTYILTPYLTLKLSGGSYGDMILVYALMSFLNIIYTYGLETGFFRFSQYPQYKKDLYNTTSISIIISTILLTGLLLLCISPLAGFANVADHPEYITIAILIVAFDSLSTIPFAKLRQDGRPLKYAFVRLTSVFLNIGTLYFLLSVTPKLAAANPNSFFSVLNNKNMGTTYVIIANLFQSAFAVLLLWSEFRLIRWHFNVKLWKEIMIYSLPMLIVGFGGMINETMDKLMLGWWGVPATGDIKVEIGTYGACYKLAILITVFIQAFRLGAEPFFFKQASGENPQRIYARVMKFFVIIICAMFLFVALYLDAWKYFIQNPVFWEGLKIVPILLLANMFLGIYYNLSVWYKITNKVSSGAWITIGGALVTITINYLFIPRYGYMASAWATFFCYGGMMVACYIWGQKEYPVPYAWKKLSAYIVIVVLLFYLHRLLIYLWSDMTFNYTTATVILGAFLLFVLKIEKNEFQKLPVVGRFLK
ncbi:lipopolysaccharide biosynthesis protein [Agriterribacter sp.]|uniref:lipopolysaccharide biosynthesis protein n=1 Tax=Agriterribacter sp. TaxID=2821509 RepID=UPI002D1A59FD|nr:oligosaccharide flippase family protein [Agriterribacter sp.]HTN05256.1 oligosaccharide flippase family protein [Agriterribacter sp.]